MRRPKRCLAIQQELSTPEDGRRWWRPLCRRLGGWMCWCQPWDLGGKDAPIAEMKDAQWRRTLGINLDSVFGLVQASCGALELQGRGWMACGAYCADHSTAGSGARLPCGLRRDERGPDQSDKEPVERAGAEGYPCELRSARLGG